MSNDVKILTARFSDAHDIAKLSYQVGKMHDEAMPDYFRKTSLTNHLQIVRELILDEKVEVFKAVKEDKICGFLFLFVPVKPRLGYIYPLTGCVLNLGVDEGYRNCGIGTDLMRAAEKFLYNKGIYAIDLSVFKFNEKAHDFYQKLGYKEIEVNMHKVLR